MSKKKNSNAKWTAKRIAALIGILLLVVMYVVTLFAAIFDSSSTGRLFRLCLGLTIAVPIFLWIFIWCIGVLEHRKTIASMEILSSNPEERRRMEEALQKAAGESGSGDERPERDEKSSEP